MTGFYQKPVVLVADDDPIVRQIAVAELRRDGYNALSYAKGVDALAHITIGERADVLVTDICMPGPLDGFLLATEVRLQRPKLPVVYISAAPPCADQMVSGSTFIRKPYHIGRIAQAVGASLKCPPTRARRWPTFQLETERKFLTKDASWKGLVTEVRHLRDRTLFQADGMKFRLRRDDRGASLTLKGPRMGLSRAECEMDITTADADALMTGPWGGPVLEKIRYHIPHAEHVWEVDVYQGYLFGLVIVQVELTQTDEALTIPPWVGREITDDPRFSQAALQTLSWSCV